jgi:hypothetical protein
MIFEYDPRQNKRLDELLRDQARELDPTRYAHVYPGWIYGQWWNFVDLPGAPFHPVRRSGASGPGDHAAHLNAA